MPGSCARVHAAIDGHHAAAYPAGTGAGQKNDDTSAFLDRPRSSLRQGLEHCPPSVRVAESLLRLYSLLALQALGSNLPGAHADDADAAVKALGAKRLSKRDQASIGDAATDVIGHRPFAGVSDDIDDHPAAAPAHCGINLAREVDTAEQLQIPALQPGLLIHHVDAAGANGAGTIDQYIDSLRSLGQRAAVFRFTQVSRMSGNLDRMRLLQFMLCPFEICLGARCQAKMAALLCEKLGDAATNTFRAARDQCALAGQLQFHACPCHRENTPRLFCYPNFRYV